MQKEKIKLLLRWVTLAIVLMSLVFLLFIFVWNYYELGSKSEQYFTFSTQLKDFDADEISKHNTHTQRAIDVLHYQIKIDLFPQEKKIIGDVTVKFILNDKKVGKIDLNFYDNLQINSLEFNSAKAKFERSEKILSVIRPDQISDTNQIRIIYEGTPKSLGFGSFNFSRRENHSFVYTMNEPVFASTWLPCVDIPDDKALIDIFISNDSSLVSLSNGKLIEVQANGARRTYHWKTIYPIATYLIAIYSGQYRSFSQKYFSSAKDSVDLIYYAFPENVEKAKADFSDHPKYLKVFEEIFGPYPFAKEKYSVAEFLWQYGAMEHQTLTGIGSNFITGKKFFSDMLIHELAHHWWGNAVSPKTWKDIWLNEGFATYSEALYWEKQSGFSALQTTLRAKFGMFEGNTLYNPGNLLFGSLIYDKGAWVLHMLRKEVGDKNFFNILKDYYSQYKYSSASTNDFKNVCARISKTNLNAFFDQWVYKGKGIIELEYNWSTHASGEGFLTTIKIKQLQNGYDIYKFPLDIKLIFADESDFAVSTHYISDKEAVIGLQTKKKPKHIELDPDKWLLADIKITTEN